jgi:hypothetical protein
MRAFVGLFCNFPPSIVICFLLLSLPTNGYAQASSASLSITISDPTGAILSGALVVIRNSETNQEQQAHSGGSGTATFSFLKPGHYSLTISKERFSDITVDNIALNVGDEKKLQQTLRVGSAAESVTVDGSGLTINTTDASVSTVIDHKFVENTPLNGRSFQDLILLTPGVVTQSPQATNSTSSGNSGDFSVNGQRTEANSYLVDGVSATTNPGSSGVGGSGNVPSSTALGTTQSLVSVDALQEFRVESSTYSAQYGRTPGGQFSFVTRSGSDDFHGTVYDYLRNNYFDANDWFNNYYSTPEAALRQNDFGVTVGGPVEVPGLYGGKGKTFFFFSYEGLRLTQPQPATLEYVPSLALRGDPTLPVALQPILNSFPLPTPGGTDYGNGIAQFVQSDSLPSKIDSTSVRIDQTLSSKVRLFFRFGDVPSSSANRTLSVYTPANSSGHTYTFGATAQISKTVSDEFRLGSADSRNVTKGTLDGFGGAEEVNLAQALGAGSSPAASAVFYLNFPGEPTNLSTGYTSNQMRQWNLTDSLSWSRGKHLFKAGVDYRRITTASQQASPSAEYLYTNQSQILSNAALVGYGFAYLPATPIYHEFSAFAQDEWQVVPRLTLSLGLRWEVNPSPGAKDGDLPYTLQGNLSDPKTLSLAPKGTQLYQTTWYNFAPRLGVAWLAHSAGGHRTVVRAGGGVFFDIGNEDAAAGYSGVGFSAQKELLNAPAPFPGGINLTPSLTPPYTSVAAYYLYPHLQLPFTLEWSAAVEQELGQSQTLTITYIGSNGRRLLGQSEYSAGSSNPNFNEIIRYYNGPTSNYQALQTKFQRTVARGVQALASFTWSHSLDYASNGVELTEVRGNSDFDVRNNLTFGATWQLPGVRRHGFAGSVLNNWAVDGHLITRTAFPVTLSGNTLVDPVTGNVYVGGLDLVPNQPIYRHIGGIPGNREINSSAFSLPVGDQNGSAPRNFVRGFGATQVNFAARRDFHLRERLAFQLRAEAFNVFNHPSFGYIDPILTDKTFGRATQTLNQSLVTVSPLYQMGGPRSMQFALKLQF